MAANHAMFGDALEYTNDNGDTTLALVWNVEGDKVNLAVYDPSNGTWTNANSVPKDSERLRVSG
jgi:hypothetical protein